MSKEPKRESLNNLQNIFHRILERYLQTSDKYYLNFIQDELPRYLSIRNREFSFYSKPVFKANPRNQSQLIIDLYNDLNEIKIQILAELNLKVFTLNIKRFNYIYFKSSGLQYQVIHFLQKESSKRLNQFITSFLIHGSFATGDFLKDWSDLDTKIILNDFVFQSSRHLDYAAKWFRKLSLLCDKIDPLSHHRFSFLTNFDLSYYPAFFLPKEVYNYALLLNGQPEIKINLRPDKDEIKKQMIKFVGYFKDKVLDKKYSRNQGQFKNDLARLMLWPSLMLQTKDIYIYKKYSFKKAKQEFPQVDFSLVDEAGAIREQWSGSNLLRYYPDSLFTLLPFRFNQIIINQYKRYLNGRPLPKTRKEIEIFTREAYYFLKKTFNLIKNEQK